MNNGRLYQPLGGTLRPTHAWQTSKQWLANRVADTSLRQRIFLVASATALVSITPLLILFVPDKLQLQRQQIINETRQEARLLAMNSGLGLSRNDADLATHLINALHINRHVTRVELLTPEGVRIAAYRDNELDAPRTFQAEDESEAPFFEERVSFVEPVMADGQQKGILRVSLLLKDVLDSVKWLAAEICALMSILLALSLVLARILGNTIAQPMARLAAVADSINQGSDFKQRVSLVGNHEMDRLIRAFNAMLETIQERDQAILRYNTSLESQVAERTRELALAKARAESASAAKTRFLGTLSHELRTPLNGILGLAGLLHQDSPPANHPMVQGILQSGETLLKHINDLISYTTLESAEVVLEFHEYSPAEILSHICLSFESQAQAKGLTLESHLRDDFPVLLLGDQARTLRALSILTENAIKFTQRGGITLSATLAGEGASQQLRYAVYDTGPGIPPEQTERLLQPFSQADDSLTRSHGGLGLGLAIFWQQVRHMGGQAHIESQPEHGSCFSFTVPVRPSLLIATASH